MHSPNSTISYPPILFGLLVPYLPINITIYLSSISPSIKKEITLHSRLIRKSHTTYNQLFTAVKRIRTYSNLRHNYNQQINTLSSVSSFLTSQDFPSALQILDAALHVLYPPNNSTSSLDPFLKALSYTYRDHADSSNTHSFAKQLLFSFILHHHRPQKIPILNHRVASHLISNILGERQHFKLPGSSLEDHIISPPSSPAVQQFCIDFLLQYLSPYQSLIYYFPSKGPLLSLYKDHHPYDLPHTFSRFPSFQQQLPPAIRKKFPTINFLYSSYLLYPVFTLCLVLNVSLYSILFLCLSIGLLFYTACQYSFSLNQSLPRPPTPHSPLSSPFFSP